MPKKVILISGGSSGLGKAIAEKLAPNNHVIILSHNEEKLREVAKEINCDYVEAELTEYETLKTAVNKVIQKHHTLDVLINNAGIWMEGELEDNDPRKIKELIDVNTTGTIFLTRAVLPGMRFRKDGQIINIISKDGLSAKKSRSVYHASKWAITGFTKCLQEDLSEENIRVTGIYPGLINTDLFQKNDVNRDLSDALDPSEVASLVEYVINLSPSIQVTEIGINNKTTKSKNMDDTNAPTIDLNIDPNMIAAQDDPPQATPQDPQPVQPAVNPPIKNPNVIDITPGSGDTFPSESLSSTHIDVVPLSEPKTVDITPPQTPSEPLLHLSDVSPDTTPVENAQTPSPFPIPVPPATSIAGNTIPDGNISETNSGNTAKSETEPITQSSPLAEDPDLVKLIK
jgi:NADP-dependent 3-hydroxy acid dehydrogenase YdfG